MEDHQEILERFTEKLSELCEKPLNVMDRLGIINQTTTTEKLCTNVLEYIEGGLEEN